MMVGETPNIDRIGHEGRASDYAEESCTAGRNAFFTVLSSAAGTDILRRSCRQQPVIPSPRHPRRGEIPA